MSIFYRIFETLATPYACQLRPILMSNLFDRLKSDVALRGGLISSAATLIAVLLLTLLFWFFLVNRLENRVEEALLARHQIAIENTTTFSDEERSVLRRFRQSLPVRDEGVFAWLDSDGEVFSSNVIGLDCREGFYDGWLDTTQQYEDGKLALLTEDAVVPDRHDRFRFLANERGDNCLVFGSSLFEVDALKNSFLSLFIWLVPLCLIPALMIGLSQSLKLRKRLIQLGNVVKELSSGDLDARMPVEGDDDIDRLSSTANRSFERLQESVNTLQQLTSVMAHDLRAPLNRVSMPLQAALSANMEGKPDVESLKEVRVGLEDARAIFDALLRISQIESGRRRSAFEEIELFDVVEGLFEIYEPVVEDSGRALELEIAGDGKAVLLGDNELIRQALVNLIENAIRYTPEGANIRMGVLRDRDYPSIFVKDNGPGVPEEERPRVLRRLYRYEGSTNNKSGHGLGLSLVKAVVDLHDGETVLEDAKPGLLVIMQFNAFLEGKAGHITE